MEIGWTDVGSGGYILVSCAHSNTSCSIGVKVMYIVVKVWLRMFMKTYIIDKTKVLIAQEKVILADLVVLPILARPFGCIADFS